jgi:hypothetical protein
VAIDKDCLCGGGLVKEVGMTGSRKVLLAVVALALLADFLPVTRDELSWWWAESHDHAGDYLSYLSDRPQGRHAAEARTLCVQRQWAETKRALIRQAYQETAATNSAAAAAYGKEKRERQQEFFCWKGASVSNTVESYRAFIRQYPHGQHAAQARRLIESLGGAASPANSPAPPQGPRKDNFR